MSLEKRGRGGTRGARTNSGVIVGGSMEDVSPPSYAQVMRNNRTNTGSNRNDWPSVGFLSGGTLMTDNLVTQSSVIVPLPKVPPLGPEPVHFPCPRCRARKLTRIHYEPNSKTHLMAALLCILGIVSVAEIMVFCVFAILLRTVREYQTSLRKLWQNFGHLLQRIISALRCIVFHKI
uniref:LITAF domain-containing protein n=1 Tax=Glossina pallidipes TaxID=7398 RepID=A0A1A9ZYN5_GLOPL